MNENEIDEMLYEINIMHNNIKKEIFKKNFYSMIGIIYLLNFLILLKYFHKNIKNKNFSATDILFILYISNIINIGQKYWLN